MTDTTAAAVTTADRRPLAASIALAVVSASVPAGVLCLLVATVAHAAGASPDMMALTPQVFIPFVVVGVLVGAIGWSVIRAKVRAPRQVLRVLVPVVLALSFIPDILVGVSRALPGTTWTGVFGLMVMHLVVAACAVVAYRIFLPVAAGRRA